MWFGFVMLLRGCYGSIVECVSTWLVGYICEVGKIVLIIVECSSVTV